MKQERLNLFQIDMKYIRNLKVNLKISKNDLAGDKHYNTIINKANCLYNLCTEVTHAFFSARSTESLSRAGFSTHPLQRCHPAAE